ncbi:MAG TPA: CPBP family intramembrane glutamic endopeptidase [Candidatus Acidoferrales bacterium]|nr:CPBP family intramembrane glutamic endopeptidase [Candidatus Acidoferrales bacterium]
MTTNMSEAQAAGAPSGRIRCWIEALALGLIVPGGVWAVDKIMAGSIPAATHGSAEQRFLLWVSHGMIVEWALVALVWLMLRQRGASLKDLGTWRFGTWYAWVLALGLAALSVASSLRFLRFMHIPLSNAFLPTGFHLVASLMIGTTAGFCEEVLFRAFLMSEFAGAGYGKLLQVLIPGLAFGLAHAGYWSQGWYAWLGIALPTAILGMLWGVAYLLGRRSLVPVMVAHFLNDATALSWILFLPFMMSAR